MRGTFGLRCEWALRGTAPSIAGGGPNLRQNLPFGAPSSTSSLDLLNKQQGGSGAYKLGRVLWDPVQILGAGFLRFGPGLAHVWP